MEFPTPDDPARSPIWDNYVTAQGALAGLRRIPLYAHAVGVEVDATRVTLVVQVPNGAPDRDEDVDNIADTLQDLLGGDVMVRTRIDTRSVCTLSPHDGVRWFFASRA